MSYSREWLIYAPQVTTSNLVTFNTTTAQFYAIPATSAEVTDGYEVDDERKLGLEGRGRSWERLGAYAPGVKLESKLYTENFLQLFRTFLKSEVKTASSDDYVYGLRYDDAQEFGFFSAQLIYKDITQFPSDALARSVLAGIVNTWAIEAAVKSAVKLTVEALAKDAALSSDNSAGDSLFWHYSATTNTPNVLATASVVAEPSTRPLWFFDGTLEYDSDAGATKTFNPTTNVLSLASMDTLARVESFKLSVNHNLDADGYELGSDRTRAAFCGGNRDIEVSLTVSWCDRSTTLYKLAQAGTPIALRLKLATAADRYIDLLMPSVFLKPFDLPAISGDKAKRTFEVTGNAEVMAVTNTTTGTTPVDLNVVWSTSENLT